MNTKHAKIKKKTVNGRYLVEEKIASVLMDSYYQPTNQSVNGAFFIDNYHFAANLKILGKKLGLNPNSLNKDFRHHNIKYIQSVSSNSPVNLVDKTGWKIYQHSNDTFSLENVLKGNVSVSTKWDKCAKTRTKKKLIQNVPLEIQTSAPTDEEISAINSNNEDNSKAVHKIITKTANIKSSGTNERFYEEEDSFLDFLT